MTNDVLIVRVQSPRGRREDAPTWERGSTGSQIVSYPSIVDPRTVALLTKYKLDGIRVDCTLAPEESVDLGASRVGGRPDLPREVPWPTATRLAHGELREFPLAFIAQIALEDVAGLDGDNLLPSTGLLSFFVLDTHRVSEAAWSHEYDDDEMEKTDRVKVFHTLRHEPLVRRETPPSSPISAASKLAFAHVETWPQFDSAFVGVGEPFDDCPITFVGDEAEEWAERAPKPPGCGMLGHPRGGEHPLGNDRSARLLLSLEAKTSSLDWCVVGRNGFIYFHAPEAAIRERDWSAVSESEW